jgi:Xaa-Pro aminopeptidase
MSQLTTEKLTQAAALLAESDIDLWLTFVRETADGGDPVLPLILEGGLTWESALMVHRAGKTVAVVGNYDADPLTACGDWDTVAPYVQGIRDELLNQLESLNPDRIGINYSLDDSKADGLSHGMFLLLTKILDGTRFRERLVPAEPIVSKLRSIKTSEELARIEAAIRTTERMFQEIERFARIGVTELDVFRHVHDRAREWGLGFSWDLAGDPIVNSGPDSMIGHGTPSPNISISPGHIFHVDLGLIERGYSSDIQRCWYVPKPGEHRLPEDVRKAQTAVNAAISAGAEILAPGVEGWRVDGAARKTLVSHGYEEYMHALGHQVGRVAHDGGSILGPRWERYGTKPTVPVESGQVYTLELGVVLPDRGYLGLEEMVVVNETGVRWLTERQLEIPLLSC